MARAGPFCGYHGVVGQRGWIAALAAGLAAGVCALLAAVPAVATTAQPAGPLLLPSTDPFYKWTGSLRGVAPGTVLRSRTVPFMTGYLTLPFTTTQVLYRTTGEFGQPTVTVATVIRPLMTSTKLVSYQMAYDSLGPQCDPSYTVQGGNQGYGSNEAESVLAAAYAALGDTVVLPDYEGEHLDWLAGREEGYNTLDGIRAAENALKLPATTSVGMVGYSGGAIATEFASELAPSYAPSLQIVGVAEGGVLADIEHNLSYVNGSRDWSGVLPAVLVALDRSLGVRNIGQYESTYGTELTNDVSDQCINSFLGSYPGLTIQKLAKPQYANVFSIPSVVKVANGLIMGRGGAPKWPVFIGVGDVDGTGDGVMIAGDDEGLAHTYCERGVPVQFSEYRGDDHVHAVVPFEESALTFLSNLLAGGLAVDDCGSIGVGNSLAPLPVPVVTVRFAGAGRARRSIRVEVVTTAGPMRRLVLELHRGPNLVLSHTLPQITGRPSGVVLRPVTGRFAPGRYTLTIRQADTTVAEQQFTIG